jgi:hypothetical protein
MAMGVAVGCSTPEAERAFDAAATTQAGSPSAASTTQPAPAVPSARPKVEKRTVTEKQRIPFRTKKVSDSTLPKGTTKVTTAGVAGLKTLTYELTFTNGVQTSKRLLRTVVTRKPVTQVVRVGTKATQRCDPNYIGACVPIASDVDCAGGSGDGPAYVRGPVTVIGKDIYDLDRNGDGMACES